MYFGNNVLLAYIDPGTGSFLLQLLIAGAVGVMAFFRKSIFLLFRRGNPKNPEAPADSNPSPPSVPVGDQPGDNSGSPKTG